MQVTIGTSSGGRLVRTKLGDVTVSGTRPNPELVKAHVARSTAALSMISMSLSRPGVYLPAKKGVPRYSADENNPEIILRQLDGKMSVGRLIDGKFVETE